MISFVYSVIFGYIELFFFDEICTYLKQKGSDTVRPCIGFAWLRRMRVRHLEYWHPE